MPLEIAKVVRNGIGGARKSVCAAVYIFAVIERTSRISFYLGDGADRGRSATRIIFSAKRRRRGGGRNLSSRGARRDWRSRSRVCRRRRGRWRQWPARRWLRPWSAETSGFHPL